MKLQFCLGLIFFVASASATFHLGHLVPFRHFSHHNHTTGQKRIIQGDLANIEDHKYFVILYDGNSLCGGALVKPNKVITAAHCVEGFQKPVKVYPGINKMSEARSAKFYESDEFYTHELYNNTNMFYDLAVIVLKESVELEGNVALIDIASEYPPKGAKITIVGHGLTDCSKVVDNMCQGDISDELRKTDMTVFGILDPMIVVRMTENRPCKGDSGGPYTYNGQLVAVESHSEKAFCRGDFNYEASTIAPKMQEFLAEHDIYPAQD